MRQHVLSGPADAAAVARASAAASAAAGRARVTIRDLDTASATSAAAELFRAIWRAPAGAAPVSADLMRALRATGNYVTGAYVGDALVGAAVAFFTEQTPRGLHSHICGVAAQMQGRSVGFALKQHQRSWALSRGITTIGWTVDPLIRRNVYFNLAKLGATVTDYLPDFYGQMADGVNAADLSDRLLLSWSLTTERVTDASAGEPCVVEAAGAAAVLTVGERGEPIVGAIPDADMLCCDVPADVVRTRRLDPPLAHSWRQALRDTLGAAVSGRYHVAGVSRDGRYVLVRDRAS